MAKVIALPTAAAAPVHNHRRAGSYGRKLVSFKSAHDRKRFQEGFERGRAGLPPKPEGRDVTVREYVNVLRALLASAERVVEEMGEVHGC